MPTKPHPAFFRPNYIQTFKDFIHTQTQQALHPSAKTPSMSFEYLPSFASPIDASSIACGLGILFVVGVSLLFMVYSFFFI